MDKFINFQILSVFKKESDFGHWLSIVFWVINSYLSLNLYSWAVLVSDMTKWMLKLKINFFPKDHNRK